MQRELKRVKKFFLQYHLIVAVENAQVQLIAAEIITPVSA